MTFRQDTLEIVKNNSYRHEGWGIDLIPSPLWISAKGYNGINVFVVSDGTDHLRFYSYPDFV